MLVNNVTENPKWSSPMVIAAKKDGTIRICVDYRKLNTISVTDTYPMPHIIDKVGGACYISTLDLICGYWQIPLAQEDEIKAVFTGPYGFLHFRVMLFGLQGALVKF